ncbi:MAG: deoxyribose-phosphate aldolase [Phycisphaerae bacterium]|jgi:deoxyribose-phosphate aldolase
MMEITAGKMAGCIDHTLLKATATSDDIKRLCDEAVRYGFACVSIQNRWIKLAAELLSGSKVKVGGVVSLPLGGDSTEIKVASAMQAIADGADEVDMVADLAAIIEGDEKYLSKELMGMRQVCKDITLKVIIEAAALTNEQKIFACRIADRCGVDFVKTSTGMNSAGGATVEDVKLMKQYAPNCKVKAAGGIRTASQAIELIEAGAERIGTSSSVKIIEQIKLATEKE